MHDLSLLFPVQRKESANRDKLWRTMVCNSNLFAEIKARNARWPWRAIFKWQAEIDDNLPQLIHRFTQISEKKNVQFLWLFLSFEKHSFHFLSAKPCKRVKHQIPAGYQSKFDEIWHLFKNDSISMCSNYWQTRHFNYCADVLVWIIKYKMLKLFYLCGKSSPQNHGMRV